MRTLWLCCVLSVVRVGLCLKQAEVEATSGTYVGQVETTDSGVGFSSFKGIKFANVVQRFKEAVPVKNDSSSRFNATSFAPPCYQKSSKYIGVEDCLYLNVYTPNINGKLPVLFFIYGGGFTKGSTTLYSPEYFMDTKRIIVVTTAYRVGPFGFLYFDDPEYPANLGLRDQILALKWVQQNIAKFGGDPGRVTLNGQSAGAASVSILMHSPLAKGLFVGAISESGTTCSPWALQPRCLGLYKLRLLATNTGCDGYLPEHGIKWMAAPLADCLSKFEPKDITEAFKNFPKWDQIVPFPPIVESRTVPSPVITIFPWLNSSSSRHLVPWITGTNSAEAMILVKEYYPKDMLTDLALRIFNGFIFADLMYYRFTAQYPMLVTADIKFHYFTETLFNFEDFISQVISLGFFYYPNYQCLITDASPSYGYFFNYRQQSASGRIRKLLRYGVGHGGELPFLWKQSPNIRLKGTASDNEISQNLVNAWVDFAYYQSANFSGILWERYSKRKNEILIINEFGARMGKNPNRGDNDFWRSLRTNLDPETTYCDF